MNRGVRERFGQWYNEIGGCMQLDTVVIRNLFAVERLAATWMLLHDCLCTAIVNGANSCRECLYVHGFMDGFTELPARWLKFAYQNGPPACCDKQRPFIRRIAGRSQISKNEPFFPWKENPEFGKKLEGKNRVKIGSI